MGTMPDSSIPGTLATSHGIAARDAARIAQVGYTAVIDRMTPEHTHELVASNVSRSIASAGGSAAQLPALQQAWGAAWQREAVTLFEDGRRRGVFGTQGLLSFGITTHGMDGAAAAVAATAVLRLPSAQLQADARALSDALHDVIEAIRTGARVPSLTGLLTDATVKLSRPAELVLLDLDERRVLPSATTLTPGQVLAVAALARLDEGPLVYQTTVLVGDDGAERLDALPLRLIELR